MHGRSLIAGAESAVFGVTLYLIGVSAIEVRRIWTWFGRSSSNNALRDWGPVWGARRLGLTPSFCLAWALPPRPPPSNFSIPPQAWQVLAGIHAQGGRNQYRAATCGRPPLFALR